MFGRMMRKFSEVVRNWRFWLNYVVTLGLTSWIPLIRVVATDPDGNVVAENYVPVYKCYVQFAAKPSDLSMLYYIGLHLGLTFLISIWVWAAVLKTRQDVDAAP